MRTSERVAGSQTTDQSRAHSRRGRPSPASAFLNDTRRFANIGSQLSLTSSTAAATRHGMPGADESREPPLRFSLPDLRADRPSIVAHRNDYTQIGAVADELTQGSHPDREVVRAHRAAIAEVVRRSVPPHADMRVYTRGVQEPLCADRSSVSVEEGIENASLVRSACRSCPRISQHEQSTRPCRRPFWVRGRYRASGLDRDPSREFYKRICHGGTLQPRSR